MSRGGKRGQLQGPSLCGLRQPPTHPDPDSSRHFLFPPSDRAQEMLAGDRVLCLVAPPPPPSLQLLLPRVPDWTEDFKAGLEADWSLSSWI